MSRSIKLQYLSVQQVPFNCYTNDFTFVVNGEEYKTNRFIADLLSPKIGKLHSTDQTVDYFILNTEQKGDFSHFLNLINFDNYEIAQDELPFFVSIIEQLNLTSIEIHDLNDDSEITIDNVCDKILIHEKAPIFYSSQFDRDIEFISTHFFEVKEEDEEKLLKLQLSTIEKIILNDHFQLKSEDQLLHLVNKLYMQNNEASILYDYVLFANLSSDSIAEFIQIFDLDDMSIEIWKSICDRLQQKVENKTTSSPRYSSMQQATEKGKLIQFNGENQLDGIINFLRKQNKENINSYIDITASRVGDTKRYPLINIINYEEKEKYTHTSNSPNSWICIEFKENKIIPSHYTIGSVLAHDNHIKSWVIEGSNDNEVFDKLDEHINCNLMNSRGAVQTFPIKTNKDKEYKFIRIRQTDKAQQGSDYLNLSCFELHGKLIF
ncbi:hypothetical protein M9Y10_006115 [Tritrichomonas musculus]|uniref:F5/8 type C domain-containing protein n=1 Tax=Tritrichomonas musculus TaxID=1915356 RepID=A0ABR2JDC0_9EUKA